MNTSTVIDQPVSPSPNCGKEQNVEVMDNLPELVFSGSVEDDVIDLSENNVASSDDDILINEHNQEDIWKVKVHGECIRNLIVDESLLEDPKISLKVPRICLKDSVKMGFFD